MVFAGLGCSAEDIVGLGFDLISAPSYVKFPDAQQCRYFEF